MIHKIEYPDLNSFLDANRYLAEGGLFLQLTSAPSPFKMVEVEIHFRAEAESICIRGEVISVSTRPESDGTWPAVLHLESEERKRILNSTKAIAENVGRARQGEGEELKEEKDKDSEHDPEAIRIDAEKVVITAGGEGNLFIMFDKLPVNEQVKLALGGNRPARQIVLRKGKAVLRRYLIKNAKIGEMEIAEIAGSRSTGRDVLERIAKNKEWMKVEAIRLNLVKNPNTPVPLAVRIVPLLNKRNMHRLLKDRILPGPVGATIRRILYTETGES